MIFRVPSSLNRSVSLHFYDFNETFTNSGSAARGQFLPSLPLPSATSTCGQHDPSMKPCTSVTEEAKASDFHAVSELPTLGFAAMSELQFLLLAPQIQHVPTGPPFSPCLTLAVLKGGFQGGGCDVMWGQMARDPLLKALLP